MDSEATTRNGINRLRPALSHSRHKVVQTAATAAVLVFASLFLSTAGATPVPINILPLGDSITAAPQGYYIAPLETLLSNNNYSPTLIANEGHSGFIIDGTIAGAPREGLREHIGPVPAVSPDYLGHPNVNATNTYILLMIGTNDVNTGFDLSTAQVQSRMSGLISAIRNEAPLAHLIVAGIVPNLGAGEDPAVQQFNADIAGVASGNHVSFVNMYPAFASNPSFQANPMNLMMDSLHPNQTGGNLMAQVWLGGIEAVPEPSSVALAVLGGLAMLVSCHKRIARRLLRHPSQFAPAAAVVRA